MFTLPTCSGQVVGRLPRAAGLLRGAVHRQGPLPNRAGGPLAAQVLAQSALHQGDDAPQRAGGGAGGHGGRRVQEGHGPALLPTLPMCVLAKLSGEWGEKLGIAERKS